MAKTSDVAKFFVMLANQGEDDHITNLKLNKLMYYAQGAYLARTGKPLFPDNIEAWTLGPVVPSVYHTYKVCGKNPIVYDEEDVTADDFAPEELEALLDVEREFGQYTGSKLVTLTHQPDTPWSAVDAAGGTVIPLDEIKAYFAAHPVPRFKPGTNCEPVDAFPAGWYDPSEDAEWEEYL